MCRALGTSMADSVPFEKYTIAVQELVKLSPAVRALFSGASHIERVDCLVKSIATQKGMQSEIIDQTVALVDVRLMANREILRRERRKSTNVRSSNRVANTSYRSRQFASGMASRRKSDRLQHLCCTQRCRVLSKVVWSGGMRAYQV